MYVSSLTLSLLFSSPLSISPLLVRGTYYIPALTYSGLMPVVLLFPNFALSSSPPDSSNEHRLLTAPAGSSLFSFVLVYRALDLSQPLYLVFSLFSLSLSLATPVFRRARLLVGERYRRKSWHS